MLNENDASQDGFLQWNEFVDMMIKMKGADDGRFGSIVESKDGKALAVTESATGGKHTYSIEERTTFAKLINHLCGEDEDLKEVMPINTEDDSLFHSFANGILVCKIVKEIDGDAIDDRAINKKANMNVYQCKENLQMGIAAAKGLGIKLIGVDSNDFINKVPHNILGFVWQALRLAVAKTVTLKDTPEIMRLAEEGESLADLNKLAPEKLLIRWVNFHLKQAGQERRIANLGQDLKDSFALFHVLNQLDKDKCPLDGINDEDMEQRAEKMIANSKALGVPDLITAKDLCKGNQKVNTIFVAEIFNTKHGLEELTKEEYEAAGLVDDDIEGSREERTFRFWINSLNIEDVYVNNLYDECNDGILLCKVIHKLDDKVVDWSKVEMNPKNDFHKNINNNMAIEACKKLKFKLIGVGAPDITKGERRSILAIVWQLVRHHYLKLIGDKSEDDLVKWANEKVGGKHPSIANLGDKSLSDGKFLIHLCGAIESRAVNWDIVLDGATDEDKQNNAKYAIAIARKLGAVIFCVWEDIVNVNKKQNLIFLATMAEIAQNL